MDGTLYLGDNVYEGAVELMEDLPASSKNTYTSQTIPPAQGRIISRACGGSASPARPRTCSPPAWRPVCTSTSATPARRCTAGTKAFYRELVSYGINLVNDELGHTEAEDVDVVVQGFDTELVYEKLDKAVHFLRRGAAFIAANPDWVCPMPAGEVLPDCGSICALLTASSGVKPTYIGKPNRNMIDVISAMTGIPNEKICAVGDRLLYRYRRRAERGLRCSVLVLSGETDSEDGRRGRAQARLCPCRRSRAAQKFSRAVTDIHNPRRTLMQVRRVGFIRF